MLAVAVHEQHGAEAGMIEAGEQRRLLAEIARQRDDLDVERHRRQAIGDCAGGVAAAVVDIDHFGGEPARVLEPARDLGDPPVQRGQAVGLVEHRHDDRQAGRRGARARAADLVGFAAISRSCRLRFGAIYSAPGARLSRPASKIGMLPMLSGPA